MFRRLFIFTITLIISIIIWYNLRLFKFHSLDYIYFKDTFEYYEYLQFEYYDVLYRDDITNFLIDEFNYKKCNIYYIDNLAVAGSWNRLNKKIRINSNLDKFNYTYTLTHELIHDKYNTADEKFVVYKTIIYLYESEIDYFKYVASVYINQFFTTNILLYDNDCKWYINEYFKQLASA